MLSRFTISPATVRIGAYTPKGCQLAQFADAFSRYLPDQEEFKRNNATSSAGSTFSAGSKPQQASDLLRPENDNEVLQDAHCGSVADEYTYAGGGLTGDFRNGR
jgi:hypothetical protein